MKEIKGLPFLAVAGLLLGVIGLTLLQPVASAADTAAQTVQVTISPILSVSIDDNKTNLSTSLGAGAAKTDDEELRSTIRVTNNNANGYTLTMNAKDDNTAMNGASSGASIPSTADGTAPSAGKSSWGVRFGATNDAAQAATWKAIPAAANKLAISSNDTSAGGSAVVQYGVGITNNQAADTYTGSVVYNVTVNAAGGGN